MSLQRILIGIAVAALLGAIVFFSIRGSGGGDGVAVDAEKVERRDVVQIVKASGEINPRVKVDLSPHVVAAARVDKLYVEEGDWVKAGQPFLELEKETFVAARDEWQSRLRSSQTAVRRGEVALADTRQKLARARQLSGQGIVSAESLEQAELAERSAELELEQARESVRQAQANLDKARDDLAKTTIYAPISGRVTQLNADVGEVVISGTMGVAGSQIGTISDLSEILAEVDVDENEIVNVRVGQEAVLKVDAMPDREFSGKAVEVGSSGYNRPQQPDVTFFRVKVLFDEPGEELRPGMSVRAEIHTAGNQGALAVPIQAVVERRPAGEKKETAGGDGEEIKVVFVVDGGKAVQRPVETGLSDETHVELTSGVEQGQTVVIGPYRTLRDLEDGDAVRIRDAAERDERRRGSDEESEEEEEAEEER